MAFKYTLLILLLPLILADPTQEATKQVTAPPTENEKRKHEKERGVATKNEKNSPVIVDDDVQPPKITPTATSDVDAPTELPGGQLSSAAEGKILSSTPLSVDGERIPNNLVGQEVRKESPEEGLEKELEEEYSEEQRSKMSKWIADELAEETDYSYLTSSYLFAMESGDSRVFVWEAQKGRSLRINVMAVELTEDGEYVPIQNAQEDEFVELYVGNEKKQDRLVGKVYVSKTFPVAFERGNQQYLRFVNKNTEKVLVVFYLQQLNAVITESVVKDSHFDASITRMRQIYKDFSGGEGLREHTYKYEWGFHEKELKHDSQFLGLTGVELIVIIITAMAQMYFIKSLLDNRAVV